MTDVPSCRDLRTSFLSQDSDSGTKVLFREMRLVFLYHDVLRG
jgi:hypothetical protein